MRGFLRRNLHDLQALERGPVDAQAYEGQRFEARQDALRRAWRAVGYDRTAYQAWETGAEVMVTRLSDGAVVVREPIRESSLEV